MNSTKTIERMLPRYRARLSPDGMSVSSLSVIEATYHAAHPPPFIDIPAKELTYVFRYLPQVKPALSRISASNVAPYHVSLLGKSQFIQRP